jgi:hypothetical protein
MIAIITTPGRHWRVRKEHMDNLREWRAKGGFRPLVEDIKREADRRGIKLPAVWVHLARDAGAAG